MAGAHPGNDDEVQSEGRKDNAAQPLNSAEPNAGAERYPSAGKDDAVEAAERRTFDTARNPQPPQGAGDGGPTSPPTDKR